MMRMRIMMIMMTMMMTMTPTIIPIHPNNTNRMMRQVVEVSGYLKIT